MWVARDKTGFLYLFDKKKPYKPKNVCDLFEWHPTISAFKHRIDDSMFPELGWDDEPLEITDMEILKILFKQIK